MHRFFVAEENRSEQTIVVTGDDVNHIRNVLRMDPGEKVVVSCGKGVDYECEITEFQDAQILLTICKETPAVTELPVAITLFQALPKKDKMELVIQKAIELGAARIVPVKAKRCVVKLDEKKEEKKIRNHKEDKSYWQWNFYLLMSNNKLYRQVFFKPKYLLFIALSLIYMS